MPKQGSMPTDATAKKQVGNELHCYHCGVPCTGHPLKIQEKAFCCEGCKLVYEILDENGLCDYYAMQDHPGLGQIKPLRQDKFAYLDSEEIAQQLYLFSDSQQAIVKLYIPGIHCSSCMWLLEHMPRITPGIIESRLNFSAKEVTIRFTKEVISLRQLVELLTTIGYEPFISLDSNNKQKTGNKARLYKLGIAGFCFGNIMMMSFPEYLSFHAGIGHQYEQLFRYLNLSLSLPVFFYCGSEFFIAAWKGLRQKILNIDAPIALALVITFSRSLYEILSGTGAGYLDSMSGIVFFMLVGRVVQERAYKSISFHRDYTAYFPIAVQVLNGNDLECRNLKDLKEGDIIQLHNDEIIPADAIVVKGKARIDYSFVTGESVPVSVPEGGSVYAGGRQTGQELVVRITKPVAGSYLTSLWNHQAFSKNKNEQNSNNSIIHLLSRRFTMILFSLAAITALYWWVHNPAMILPSVSAMLIVACPCALLLSSTYTNGNLLRIFSNNGLFLRDATVIEQLGNIDHIVFDKTGTLTTRDYKFHASGHPLTEEEKDWITSVARPSKHPYSKAITTWLGSRAPVTVTDWTETAGQGIQAMVKNNEIRIGSAAFTGVVAGAEKASVYLRINDHITSCILTQVFRDGMPQLIKTLAKKYSLSLLSGDNDQQRSTLTNLFGLKTDLLFQQKPIDKLHYIELLQQQQHTVLMIGDGLNDAGALQQSNVGITIAEDINNFTPACDAILDATKFDKISALLKLSKSARQITGFSFAISIFYNIIGLGIAIQGHMSPMIAAILMPVSTLSIVLITTGTSSLMAKRLGLKG